MNNSSIVSLRLSPCMWWQRFRFSHVRMASEVSVTSFNLVVIFMTEEQRDSDHHHHHQPKQQKRHSLSSSIINLKEVRTNSLTQHISYNKAQHCKVRWEEQRDREGRLQRELRRRRLARREKATSATPPATNRRIRPKTSKRITTSWTIGFRTWPSRLPIHRRCRRTNPPRRNASKSEPPSNTVAIKNDSKNNMGEETLLQTTQRTTSWLTHRRLRILPSLQQHLRRKREARLPQ